MKYIEPSELVINSDGSVFHLHMHVIPRFDGIALKPHTGTMEKPEVLSDNAAKIRAALVAQNDKES